MRRRCPWLRELVDVQELLDQLQIRLLACQATPLSPNPKRCKGRHIHTFLASLNPTRIARIKVGEPQSTICTSRILNPTEAV